jgi:hypothetical protein
MLSSHKKAFDCVKMKRKAQEEVQAEYAARRDEFPSYFAFLEAKTTESAWQKELWSRVAAARSPANQVRTG